MSKPITEKDMLEEVGFRNMIAKFTASNLRKRKIAAVPRVGIFWVDSNGTVYSESTSLREAEDYGDVKTHSGSHYKAWRRAIRTNPSWAGSEYEEVPRGRVVYKKHPKSPEFVVYMPKQIAKYKAKIAKEFMLPLCHTKFDFSDEHYRMSGTQS